jgi:type IV pilus assembly protein PilE
MEVRGFTLIELMIVVAVIGILASIAYPVYEDSVRKANRRAAQGFMLDIANREQQFFLDNRAYTDTIKPPGGLNLPTPSELDKPDPGKRYDFAVDPNTPAGPPPCFTITATARNRQVPDGDMTLDCRGAKTRGGVAGW